jgi:hypothetical protein
MKKIFFENKLITVRISDYVFFIHLFNDRLSFCYVDPTMWGIGLKLFKKERYFRAHDYEALANRFKRFRNKAKLVLYPLPVYFECDSMDCDTYQTWRAYKFKCGYLASKYIDRSYEEAEGPTYWTRLTKDEYNEFQESSRDHRAEYYNF